MIVTGVCHHDCPDSCAWEVTVEGDGAARRAVKLRGSETHPFTRGELCPKVNRFLDRVYHPDRIVTPLIRTGTKGAGSFRPAGWDEALEIVAGELSARVRRFGVATVLPYVSAGNQSALSIGSMSERFFNRLGASVTTGSLCGSTALAGVRAAQGTGLGIDPEDLRHSRTILLWGTNTLVTNRHLWPVLDAARRDGATVVCIDPLRTATAAAADWHVQLLPGTDTALALGMAHVIIEQGLVDDAYVEQHASGFETFAAKVRSFPPQRVGELCGLPPDDVVRLATLFATQRPAAIRVLIGMEHRQYGAMAYRSVACLPALTGAWRDRGGGLCRSVGSLFGELLPTEVLARPDLARGPRRPLPMVQLGRVLTDPDLDPAISVLVVSGCNPAVVVPDQSQVVAGLARDDLFTVVLEQFVTDTARYADVVLPVTTQIEQLDLTPPWGHLYLALNNPAIPPVGDALSTTEIFRRLAAAMSSHDRGFAHPAFADSDETMLRDLLAAADHPFMAGITWERLQSEPFVRIRVPDDWRPFAQGNFPTADGRVSLAASPLGAVPEWRAGDESPHGDGALRARHPLACITTKSQVRFLNSSYSVLPAHRDAEGEPQLEMDPVDAAARGLADGDRARVFNDRGTMTLRVRLSGRVRPGVVAVPFGWTLDAAGGSGCNVLTSDRLTDLGGGSAYHDVLVQVERLA